ncbi:MAG: ankyrin repeat domain-containing protein [Candidatus Riflebacteria bacterium]|nr:ankyrin repeat domain-containing protein [Candidatus Riflebacteria bacterium]
MPKPTSRAEKNNYRKDNALNVAARNGDIAVIRQMIATEGSQILASFSGQVEQEPTIPSLWLGISDAEKALSKFKREFDLDDPGFAGNVFTRPLIEAILGQNLEMVRFLIEQGANVEQPTLHKTSERFYFRPLHLACLLSNMGIIRLLTENGANQNCYISCIGNPAHLFMIGAAKGGDQSANIAELKKLGFDFTKWHNKIKLTADKMITFTF